MGNRIWNHNSRVSREVLFTRRSVMDGMKWAGTKLLCRMSWSEAEYQNGKVEHCPYCWDDLLKQVSNSRCPHCHGTGFKDAYAEPFIVWGSIKENQPTDEVHEKAGYRDQQNMQLTLPSEPIFKDGDIFAEIRCECNGHVTEIGRVFQLDGPVERQTLQGWVSDNAYDGERRTRVEDIIIAQRGTVKLLLPSDTLYETDPSFWGVCDGPHDEGPYSEVPQGDMPTVDVDMHCDHVVDPYCWW